MKSLMSEVSLLIVGYDPYVDVWNHYFELLDKYWPNHPQAYLATNKLTPNYRNIVVLPAGEDAEWSKKVIEALPYISTKYVILLLEDFFTTSPVDNSKISELLDLMNEYDLKYCKLLNQSRMRGKKFANKKYLKIIDKNSDYGISLQPAIWEKEFLSAKVGKENYNAWIFEFNQVKLKDHNKEKVDCISDSRNVLNITHAIVQSKYLRKAVRIFKKQSYVLNTSVRPMLSKMENFKYRMKGFAAEYTPRFLVPLFKVVGRLLKVDFVSDRQLRGGK